MAAGAQKCSLVDGPARRPNKEGAGRGVERQRRVASWNRWPAALRRDTVAGSTARAGLRRGTAWALAGAARAVRWRRGSVWGATSGVLGLGQGRACPGEQQRTPDARARERRKEKEERRKEKERRKKEERK
jgi:hypothetical protein